MRCVWLNSWWRIRPSRACVIRDCPAIRASLALQQMGDFGTMVTFDIAGGLERAPASPRRSSSSASRPVSARRNRWSWRRPCSSPGLYAGAALLVGHRPGYVRLSIGSKIRTTCSTTCARPCRRRLADRHGSAMLGRKRDRWSIAHGRRRPAEWVSLGEWLVEPRDGRVDGQGRSHTLPPHQMRILVCLASITARPSTAGPSPNGHGRQRATTRCCARASGRCAKSSAIPATTHAASFRSPVAAMR